MRRRSKPLGCRSSSASRSFVAYLAVNLRVASSRHSKCCFPCDATLFGRSAMQATAEGWDSNPRTGRTRTAFAPATQRPWSAARASERSPEAAPDGRPPARRTRRSPRRGRWGRARVRRGRSAGPVSTAEREGFEPPGLAAGCFQGSCNKPDSATAPMRFSGRGVTERRPKWHSRNKYSSRPGRRTYNQS
jgi:hypothetical protein